jgi:undecaprenyl-diphosphatase
MSPAVLLSRVAHSDDWVCARLERWRPPAWVEAGLVAATRLGDGWAWLAVVLTALGRGDHSPAQALTETAAAIVVVNLAQVALKQAFRRSRPQSARPPSVRAPDRFSFPSGHAMNAFAVAVLVGFHWPWGLPWAVGAATGVAGSRVVLRVHYVSDVLAGAWLGSVLAALVASAIGV